MMVEVSPGRWMDVTPGRQAVVLSGGASYAAYEVGVLKALLGGSARIAAGQPLDLEIFTGTSAGSFNAAFMTSRWNQDGLAAVEDLEQLWLGALASSRSVCMDGAVRYRLDPRYFFNPECLLRNPFRVLNYLVQDTVFLVQDFYQRAVNFFSTNASLERRLLELIDISTILSLDPAADAIRHYFDLASIRASPKELRVVATNWTTGEAQYYANADLTDDIGHDVILASCSFPGSRPVSIHGQYFVDGGYVMNTPLRPAIDAGADTIHVVYLDPEVRLLPDRLLFNTLDTMDKMYAIFMATIFNRDIEWAADINAGLRLLESSEAGQLPPQEELQSLLRSVGAIAEQSSKGTPYRKVTIHRYRPHEDLGGVIGLLDFERNHLADLIERGFQDALEHDCIANECSLTGAGTELELPAGAST